MFCRIIKALGFWLILSITLPSFGQSVRPSYLFNITPVMPLADIKNHLSVDNWKTNAVIDYDKKTNESKEHFFINPHYENSQLVGDEMIDITYKSDYKYSVKNPTIISYSTTNGDYIKSFLRYLLAEGFQISAHESADGVTIERYSNGGSDKIVMFYHLYSTYDLFMITISFL